MKWETSVEKISEKEYDVVFTANIESGWHLYSQYIEEGGPLPTVFKFMLNGNYTCEGKPKEENAKEVYEDVFDMNVKYFEGKVVFKQRIKITITKPFKIEGDVNYMSCNNEKCLPGKFKFLTSIN
ncbi:hypothetical protein GCM10011368_13540 [Hyunsoonleella pacifica]|nr:hypothetical protein GCM10011368_13540 [Hyunsoonleella pacifica]